MQRELYEVEKDRFDLKDSSLYHLQGTWPKDHKPEAVLDGEKLPAAISAQERVSALERFKDLDLVNGERVQMEICLPDLAGKKKLVGNPLRDHQTETCGCTESVPGNRNR